MRSVLAVLAVLGGVASAAAEPLPAAGPTAFGPKGMVVSVSAPASEVGAAVLKRGGNAVDAAVATAFALAVTWPEAGNIGGGGFMLVVPAKGAAPVVIDYRETAPAAATADMYANGIGSQYRLVGTPGTVRGLALGHKKFGKLPWKEVVEPAVRLAADGVPVDAALAGSLNGGLRRASAEFARVFGKAGGGQWVAGDKLVQPDLAKTLRLIADQGPDAFYRGPLADLLVAEMKWGGGLITAADLAAYEAKVREPVRGTFRGYDVLSAPPPSSGGTGVVEILNILEPLDLRKHDRWSPRTVHLTIEAMRRAYLDRARHLGDPDFAGPPPAKLTDPKYGRELAAGIDPAKATRSSDLATDIPLAAEPSETTHFSVVDADGTAVANTYTLEQVFGSRVVVTGAGYVLNNEMGDFNPVPGRTDRRGKIGTAPNLVAPGKRMLSSMTPTVVTKDGKVVLVTGSPGGRTIINTVTQVVLNVLEFDMPLREAVDAPRMHHAWMPDAVRVEDAALRAHPAAFDAVRKMGHTIESNRGHQGDAHSIRGTAEGYEGVADRRRAGWAVGY